MPSRNMPGLGLSAEWSYGEDGWNTGTDSNWRTLSILTQLSVLSATEQAPASPAQGARYIVPVGATGDWAGQDRKVACWDQTAWLFLDVFNGFTAYVEDAQDVYLYEGNWAALTTGGGGATATDLGYNAGARLLTSSTGNNVTLPHATGALSGLLSAAGYQTLQFAAGIKTVFDAAPDGYVWTKKTDTGTYPYGAFDPPSGGAGATNLSWDSATGTMQSSSGTDAQIPEATTTNKGLLSPEDKAFIGTLSPGGGVVGDGVPANFETLLDLENHDETVPVGRRVKVAEAAAGCKEEAWWIRVVNEPTHSIKKQTTLNEWFELDEREPHASMWYVEPDGTTNWTPRLRELYEFCAEKNYPMDLPPGRIGFIGNPFYYTRTPSSGRFGNDADLPNMEVHVRGPGSRMCELFLLADTTEFTIDLSGNVKHAGTLGSNNSLNGNGRGRLTGAKFSGFTINHNRRNSPGAWKLQKCDRIESEDIHLANVKGRARLWLNNWDAGHVKPRTLNSGDSVESGGTEDIPCHHYDTTYFYGRENTSLPDLWQPDTEYNAGDEVRSTVGQRFVAANNGTSGTVASGATDLDLAGQFDASNNVVLPWEIGDPTDPGTVVWTPLCDDGEGNNNIINDAGGQIEAFYSTAELWGRNSKRSKPPKKMHGRQDSDNSEQAYLIIEGFGSGMDLVDLEMGKPNENVAVVLIRNAGKGIPTEHRIQNNDINGAIVFEGECAGCLVTANRITPQTGFSSGVTLSSSCRDFEVDANVIRGVDQHVVVPNANCLIRPMRLGGPEDPEGFVSYPPGTIWQRQNGPVYRKASGDGATGWVTM